MESRPSSKRKWELTRDAFDGLLAQIDPNRDAAGTKYENTRTKLMRFFERRACPSPEDHADEVINIVARQLAEGKVIESMDAYFLAVAKRHVLTITRGPVIESIEEPDALPGSARWPGGEPPASDADVNDIQETRLKYLEHCLGEIGAKFRALILGYYEENKQAKIDNRKALAESFGIDLNALRIRVCRIRMKLEKCVNDCVEREAGSSRVRR